ncbi:MAG TPA: phosphatidylserine/phosphatidylglycerophosphate/cardiolipin synthase family protein [Acidobacteriaceae bacterium]|jgi:cardiolipin synthase|nr:phosphatidylserine/phosphatidylglycerophosphate/cardiolipin synthase family protein [Acidobacteriaceae bacterium]
MARKQKLNAGEWLTRGLATVGAGALALGATTVLVDFFGSPLSYTIRQKPAGPLDSDEFLQYLSVVTDGALRRTRATRLRNGAEFYPSEVEAIRHARQSINLEYYEFAEGRVGEEILDGLRERARAGVEVRLVVDAVGSLHTRDRFFDGLRSAGGHMRWYNPLRLKTWQRVNNRTHRKLMIVDGDTGFIGGAGVADHWLYDTAQGPAWRDTVFRVEGEGIAGLISTFSENWLECSGEILSGSRQFGSPPGSEGAPGFVVISTPHGGGTQARTLFQVLIQCARHSLRITTPYFLPDRSAREALAEAARRGVRVEILTAGPHIDHPVVRRLSRESSRRMLEAGASIHEYQPSMIHAKLMTVDHQWCVVGSTNFDHRSFGLNDEVNLAVLDRDLAAVIESDFEEDLRQSRPLTLAVLGHRRLSREDRLLDHVVKWES